jgi:hypothetical protein
MAGGGSAETGSTGAGSKGKTARAGKGKKFAADFFSKSLWGDKVDNYYKLLLNFQERAPRKYQEIMEAAEGARHKAQSTLDQEECFEQFLAFCAW